MSSDNLSPSIDAQAAPQTPPTPEGMADKEQSIRDVMERLRRGETVEGVTVHYERTPTDDDWAALDPNSYETTCAACDTPYEGQFGPDHSLATPCPNCGSTEIQGGIGSPAGGMHLLLWSHI